MNIQSRIIQKGIFTLLLLILFTSGFKAFSQPHIITQDAGNNIFPITIIDEDQKLVPPTGENLLDNESRDKLPPLYSGVSSNVTPEQNSEQEPENNQKAPDN